MGRVKCIVIGVRSIVWIKWNVSFSPVDFFMLDDCALMVDFLPMLGD